MAATTLAQSLGLIGDKLLMELIAEAFVHADPFAARMAINSDGVNGFKWRQKYRASNADAAAFTMYGTATPSAATWAEYESFLTMAHRGDQYNMQLQSLGTGDTGFDDKMQKQRAIFDALAKYCRQKMVVGEPATSAIGATLQNLLGASATIEHGCRLFDFDDVHPQDGSTYGTVQGSFKWTNGTAKLQYKAPGDSYYGPAQTISSTNWYRVPLFSGVDSSNTPNKFKWIRVTCAPYATILAASDYESDTTSAKTVTFTPSVQPHGIWRLMSPVQSVYGDLTGAAVEAGTTAVGNGPASGYQVNRKNLSWMRKRLLDASNGDPTRCAILAPENLITGTMEGLVTHLGHGVDPVFFMGEELNDGFAFGNVPVFDNAYVPTNLSPSDGSRSDLTAVIGVVLGPENVHMKSKGFTGDINMSQASNVQSGGIAYGDGTPNGTPIPVQYYEQRNSSNNLVVDMNGYLTMEMVSNLQDICAITHVFNQ